jgi:nicotinamide/nicotinate riboside kinase
MHQTIEYIKANGSFPPDFSSHDHLNSQPDCPISESIFSKWASRFASLSTWLPADGVRLMLADGFLLYYDPAVRSSMEVKIFLRTPKEVLKQRREQRPGYATAEGTVWKDPEGYFDNIVWPAYELAHKDVFTNQDVETGDVVIPAPGEESRRGGPVDKLIVLDAKNPNDTTQAGPKQKNTANGEPTQFSHEMTALVDEACKAIWEYLTSEFGIPEA